jgi:Uma2 family endonuclease
MNGDQLTRDEFERRYRAMPDVKKAELIEGVVYMPSPVRYESHSKPHVVLATWIGYYAARTPGLRGFGDNGTVRLDNDNEPQPDLFLLLPAHLGGKSKIDQDDYISGAPALVCEVSGSSVSIDLHLKKTAYRRNGVQEYLVWRTEDSVLDWFSLVGGEFVPIPTEADGTLRSRIFPGLWLKPASLIGADLPAVFAVVDAGTATPEHADFVKRLAAV